MNSEDKYLANTYPRRGIELVKGSGALLYDSTGKEYLDLTTQVGVALLGYSHPKLNETIKKQVDNLIDCYSVFNNDARGRFLEQLASITPGDLNKFFLSLKKLIFGKLKTEYRLFALKFLPVIAYRPLFNNNEIEYF